MANKRVLIVDDDEEFCGELAESLERAGCTVTRSTDAVHAEKIIQEGKHDVVLLDEKMPRVSGLDILKRLDPLKTKSRIIVVSGSHLIEKQLKEHGLWPLVTEVMAKPIDFKKLLEKINQGL
ncbi:response regulator [candidate division FCPU426 bacterium]|nr:response regulator [candidate division FCPU426 bacterium]